MPCRNGLPLARHARPAMSLIELLVVMAVIGTLLGIVIPAVQLAREAAQRARCLARLRQIGVALHAHHDALARFPGSLFPDGTIIRTLYWQLRPYGEQGGNDGSVSTPEWLCPSRRADTSRGKADFGAGAWDVVPYAWERPGTRIVLSLPVSLDDVTRADGTAHTFLLAHKGLEPKHYAADIAGPNPHDTYCDRGWNAQEDSDVIVEYDHARFRYVFLRDTDDGYDLNLWNALYGARTPTHMLLTSPHASGMPVLNVDGAARVISFTRDVRLDRFDAAATSRDVQVLTGLWHYNDGLTDDSL